MAPKRMTISLASLLVLGLSGCGQLVQQVSAADDTTITCRTEWSDGEAVVIPEDRINDGYCDCPYSGADETKTEACSGATVGGWPGIASTTDDSLTYSCPQQPRLHLPISRVNDGICDCCDGSDESARGNCPDICEQVLAEERAVMAKAQADFAIGSEKRAKDLHEFAEAVAQAEKKADDISAEIESIDDVGILNDIESVKSSYLEQRIAAADVASEHVTMVTLFQSMTDDEIISLIVHACQVAGEMEGASDDGTCVPLRLAGFEASVVWDKENFEDPESVEMLFNGFDEAALLDVVAKNARHPNAQPLWDISSTANGRQRLEEVYEDDPDYMGDYNGDYGVHDHYSHYDDIDGVDGVDDVDYEIDDRRSRASKKPGSALTGKQREAVTEVQKTTFSHTRSMFVAKSMRVVTEITKLLDAASDDDTDVDVDDTDDTKEGGDADTDADAANDGGDKETSPNFDPAALTMVRTTLKRRQERIMRGLKYAASAKHLLRPSVFEGADEDEKRMLLVSLATGVLYHSKLRTIHVWQILQTILPEFEPSFVKDEKTCSSPWSVACPPKLAKRSSGGSVPPQFTLATAETFCNEQVEEALEGVCGGDAESGDVSDSVALPSSAPDGQYGYHEITPRDASDPLAVAFEYLDSVTIPKSQLDDLEAKLKGLHNRSKDLNRKIDQLWKTVGGREQDRMGPNGELFGISNECFVVEAGKYEYELCIFGKAYQRDRGGASKSGTSLGSWRKMEVDEESGNRIFRWEGGAKCWNGPERSATAVVTCGAETRVLSADEPETCAYGMQMESHIACDDTFRKQNEIPLP